MGNALLYPINLDIEIPTHVSYIFTYIYTYIIYFLSHIDINI